MEEDPAFTAALEAGRYQQKRFHELREVTDAELLIAAYLAALPPSLVTAGDSAALLKRGFIKGECHRNCMGAAAEGLGAHVFGWSVGPDRFLSHSVIRVQDGSLHCITPDHADELDPDRRFAFIEDRSVTCDGKRMYWQGEWLHPFNTIIRGDPEAVRARYQAIHNRVRLGEIRCDEALAGDAPT